MRKLIGVTMLVGPLILMDIPAIGLVPMVYIIGSFLAMGLWVCTIVWLLLGS